MYRFLFLSVLLVFTSPTFAQNSPRKGFRITTLPSQYLYRDLNITVERLINRFTIGGTLSYRIGLKGSNYYGDGLVTDPSGSGLFSNKYLIATMGNRFSTGYTIGLNAKYYIKQITNTFFEFYPFYRHWGIKDEHITYYPESTIIGFSGKRTESIDIYGFKLLFGFSRKWHEEGAQFLIDFHVGSGWRLKTYYFETRDGYVNGYLGRREEAPYIRERGSFNTFSLHVGIKLGVGWNDKSKPKVK